MPDEIQGDQGNLPLNDPPSADRSGEGSPAAAAPAPTYVTVEQMQEQNRMLLERIGGLVQGLNLRGGEAPVAPPPPARPEIDLGGIEDDIRQGREGAAHRLDALIQDRVERGVSKALSAVDQLSGVGLPAMEKIARNQAMAGKRPEQVKRFGKELDEFMQTVPVEARANPDSWSRGWAYILGQHHEELVAEERQQVLRAETERKPERADAARASRLVREDGTAIPSFEQWAGEESLEALRDKYKHTVSGDEYAKNAGFDSWRAFYDAQVAPFDRMDINEYATPRELQREGFQTYREMIDAKTGQTRGSGRRGH